MFHRFLGLRFHLIYCLISLTLINKICAQEQDSLYVNIIDKGSEWSYHDEDYLDNKDWLVQQFLISTDWKTGKAPLGYNVDNLETVISFGQDSTKKTLTSYYHKAFFIKDISDFYAYKLNVRRDDGAIIYINGKEVWRTNMPSINEIKNKTKAVNIIKGSKEDEFYTKILFPNNFLNGINIIAVEIHQRGQKTSDSVFDLELLGSNDLGYLKDFLINQDNKNIELKEEIKALNYKIEIEKHKKELTSFKTKNTILKILLIISVLALLIGVTYILFLIRNKFKLNNTVQNLKESTVLKEKELLNLSLRNIQSKQQIELIDEDLKVVIKNFETIDKKNSLSDLKALNKTINQNLSQENEWLELQRHFNLVHSGFFSKLSKEYPSLSQNELRHCSLIKLHLSTKEIARYLYISPKSVQASRYRIKKKMQLDEATDLKSYLLNY